MLSHTFHLSDTRRTTGPLEAQEVCQRKHERQPAELKEERNHSEQLLCLELRQLREEAEQNQQKTVSAVIARHGCQKQSCLYRLLRSLEKELNYKLSDSVSTEKQRFCSCSRETLDALEDLLLTLSEKINVAEGVNKLRPKQELELEKAIIQCHLLKVHRRLEQESHRARLPSDFVGSASAQTCETKLTYSKATIQRTKRVHILSRNKLDTCQSGSLKICHPHNTPHAGLESCGPHEPSPSKCTDRNMEEDMFDLCTRPEQPQPALGDAEMASTEDSELFKQTLQESKEQTDDSPRLLGMAQSNTVNNNNITSTSVLGKRHHSVYAKLNGFDTGGIQKSDADYGFLVRQNTELLRALDELEKTCNTLREENGLLRKSSAPETEEKVRRLRRKNTELTVLAKKLEERARKLQEANLKVVNSPSLIRPPSVEQYKRAFARQRARDLARHADVLLSRDKEIAALQQECRELEAKLGTSKGSHVVPASVGFEKLLRESQKEVLRLQRQLSVSSSTQQHKHGPKHIEGVQEKTDLGEKVAEETPSVTLDEAPSRCEKTPGEEEEESGLRVTPPTGLSPTPSRQEDRLQEQQLKFLESELSRKRKECENLEHEVTKRQKRCLDLESQLEDERGRNEQIKEEADLLRRKAQLLDQTRAENEELREDLSEVTAQHKSVLEENQRLRAKLENLEQVLKHMREVAERRQQLELEHEQALAILKFKQDEIKRLQRAQLFAKREHEGVVQMLESTLDCMQSKVRDLEEKCRSQSEQFGLLSQELEKFRLQASKVDLAGSSLLNNPSLSVLTNGVGLTTERVDCTDGTWDMVSLGEIAFWSLEGGDALSCPEDVAAALRIGTTPHAAGLSRMERSPVTKHRELPTISVSKSGSPSKSEATHLSPKSDTHLSPHKSPSPIHEVDTASEVDELDIDVAPAPYSAVRGAAKLQVFIARYSYNPYDGPNDNPEVELPLTAGEYIYVYGDMDDDGFYEGELMDGRRGLVPSNFVERVSDDDMMSTHHPDTGDISHNSVLDSSLHSASHQHHLHTGAVAPAASGPSPAPSLSASALAVPAPLTNGLDLDLEEVGVDTVPYPRKLTLIKQLAKSIIIGWDPPLVPAGWGNVWSYNVYVDQELRLNVPFGAQTKAVLERLDINLKAYRVSVQSLTEKGLSDQLRCSMLVGRDVCVAPTQLRVERIAATSANLTWLPSNSNYVHIVSLNEEECELVKAGCYSLCLSNLLPSQHYTVKVEARPHRTPWELPVERREHRSSTITFSTLMAVTCPQSGSTGPPDAPLDVQLEQGPSPGIALISWLPVTIDAAGTSNGVRVTGYTIYADKRKVLEVSSPTAGSALLGPSQIQSLQSAQELTVRTTSAHGESCDSMPVNVPSKLAAIIAGPAPVVPIVPPQPCSPAGPSLVHPSLSYGKSAAKVSSLPSNSNIPAPTMEAAANPHALHPESLLPPASYVKAWANPSSAAAFNMCDAILPGTTTITPMVNVSPVFTSAPQQSSVAAPSQVPAVASAVLLEQRRDADSPGTIRPFPSITEFIEDPCAKLSTPERIPTPPKAPVADLNNVQEHLFVRPSSTSPQQSEFGEVPESTRLVSIDEFLRQDQNPDYRGSQQNYSNRLAEPPSEYLADNSRSDLSDILEEEEEELYSDPHGDAQTRTYFVRANRSSKFNPDDGEEEVIERIVKIPAQVSHTKQLFTAAEEGCDLEEHSRHLRQHSLRPCVARARNKEELHHVSQPHPHQPNPHLHIPPQHHHFNRDPRPLTKEPLTRQGSLQVKPKMQHRVHYAVPLDNTSYPEDENTNVYQPPGSRHNPARCGPQLTPSKDRVLLRGLGDRLRREAMLRSQKAVATAPNSGHGPALPKPYLVSKTVRTVKSPTGRGLEIDVEYGPNDNEEPVECSQGEVVVDEISSEWWVETGQLESSKASHRRRTKSEPAESSLMPPSEAGPTLTPHAEVSSNPSCLQTKHPKGVDPSAFRIFVALFPYNPATMSPNPDAAEEELPFSEGQIIKVYGDKDADGFYRGESRGRMGFVPCNMVSEIQVEDEETRQQLLQQGFLTTTTSLGKIGTRTHAQLPRRPVPPPKPRRSKKDPSQSSAPAAGNPPPKSRRMVAIFDYDPRESSPNTDIEAELTFSAGDVIHVFGDMDEDGFFYGDLNGQRGLVPSNFLQAVPETAPAPEHKKESQETRTCSPQPQPPEPMIPEEDSRTKTEPPDKTQPATASNHSTEPDVSPAPSSPASPPAPPAAESPTHPDVSTPAKKKKSFFSKGKKLFRRLGGSKKE
ncbi:peripheral-type benzodiazepine receptor-associated protein 1 isoform X9 [Synchiropus splendidus]|uniref:peripheral-type benzodiazepine receptor-associated protein 1 isoform X9 n=1 Tax=Synchiropus splendidus TaxID=270530 RepID=UPI00237D988E|nr:peripheral-type benzodiazepine receptor-associated protein 1 isoform X9 [Synchiropus splendidus]